ncbi:MAG: hypothetical protein AB1894_24555 [Chloroflexota bacterium]
MCAEAFINWLLQAQTPSIRYLTHRHLMDQPESMLDVQAVRAAMTAVGPVPEILAQQTKTGAWAREHSYYTPKYTSTHWSMLLLSELAVDPQDARLRKGALFMLGDTWEELQKHLESGAHGLTCFWANLLRYTLYCGLADDPRRGLVVETLVHDALQAEWRCIHNYEYPCAWGAARALWALAALPEERSNEQVEAAIRSALAFLLEDYHLQLVDYPVPERAKTHPMWGRLNFPLFYQADILLVLRALAELNALDHPGAGPALDWLQAQRTVNGRWRGASPYRGRTWPGLGGSEETDRWVSLQAALILKHAGVTV